MCLYSHIYGHIIHKGQDMEIIFLLLFSLYVTTNSVTPWTAVRQVSLFTVSQNLLKLTSSESVMPSNRLILYCPLVLLPSLFPSIWVFSNQSLLHIGWPEYRAFSFSISPSNEYSSFISFRIDWFDLRAVQGTLKSLLQYHNMETT